MRMTEQRPQPPNFLFIIADQMRANDLGVYGNPIVRTPWIDGLAASGWLAERCYVTTPICMPNRASIMTGRMPSAHGVRHNGIPLSTRATTFVDVLREAGYMTRLVGKSHLQNMFAAPAPWLAPRPRPAWDAWRMDGGLYNQECGPLWRHLPEHRMELPFYGFGGVDLIVDHGDDVQGHYRRWLEREHPEAAASIGRKNAIPTPDYRLSDFGQAWRTRVPEELYTTSWVADRTMDAIDDAGREGRPFFIQCSFPDPHHPFTVPGKYWDMYHPDDVELPHSFEASRHCPQPPHVEWLHALRDSGKSIKHTPMVFACTEREAREATALNYGSVSLIDSAVGRVLGHLEKTGFDRDTVIIFTSDHGEYLGDHQLLWKGPLHYQSVIRVPFIWRDPLGQHARSSQALCSSIDIAPSILERAGLEVFNGVQGMSLLATMHGRVREPRQHLLIEEEGQRIFLGMDRRVRMRTLQTMRHRLSIYDGVAWGEMYDLAEDPHEMRNLWNEPAYGGLRSELVGELAYAMLDCVDTSPFSLGVA